MLNYFFGKPNENKKDFLIQFVQVGTNEYGFDIEKINPNERIGVANYLIKIDCLYLDNDFSRINLDMFLSKTVEALEGMFAFGEPKSKWNVAFSDIFDITYRNATLLFLISRKFTDTMDFFVFIQDLESRLIFDELSQAINTIKSDKDYRLNAKSLYGKNILTKAQECIIEKTFALTPDFSGKTLKIIDTHNLYHRNFHGMPDLRSSKDVATAVIKSLIILVKGLKVNPVDYIIFASEGSNGIRYDIFDDYKGNRSKMDDDLVLQIKSCNDLIEKMGFSLVREKGFEADDIIGSYTRYFERYGGKVQITTGDKDMYQLISDNVSIYDPGKRKWIVEEDWMKKFEVSPDKIGYSLAIQGDTSDNVPGIAGIGKVGAAKLINEFGDIEGIINGAESLKKSKMKEHLLAGFDDLRMSYDLVKLYDFLAEEADFNQFKFPSYNYFYLIEKELNELEINI